jgi:uncharacterized membrane protein
MQFLEHYLVAALIFVIIDAIWIAVIANKFYKSQIGNLLRAKPDFVAAAVFYLLYLYGLLYFVVEPGLKADSFSFVVTHGALLGLVMYATYDLTNLSTLKGWTRKLTVVDMAWGTILTAAVSTITFAIFHS